MPPNCDTLKTSQNSSQIIGFHASHYEFVTHSHVNSVWSLVNICTIVSSVQFSSLK